MSRLAFRSRRVVTPDGIVDGAVVVEGETIAAITTSIPNDAIDLGDHALLPGLVDSHAHLNEPGRTEWEGYDTATRAAAAGGVTTIVDMPLNCIPVTTSLAALQLKRVAVADHAHVDYAMWGGIVPGNTHELAPMIAAGIAGFKAFLCHSGIDDFPAATEADLRKAMPILARAGVPLLVHAELESGAPATWNDPTHYADFVASRPARWEVDAISMMIALCRETGCAVHIVHLSAADALAEAERARDEGLPLSLETCPHYLLLRAEDIGNGHTEFKCAPPIRDGGNQDRLWQGLSRGLIDMVVSDHSPCTPQLKHLEAGDFDRAWGGIASLQLGLPLVWTEAKRREFSLDDIVRWMSARPAQLAGLAAQKGAIAVGMDADLVVFDSEAQGTITKDSLEFRHKLTPYLGRTVTGAIVQTWLRGALVHDRGTYPTTARGRHLLRPYKD